MQCIMIFCNVSLTKCLKWKDIVHPNTYAKTETNFKQRDNKDFILWEKNIITHGYQVH